MLYVSFVFCCVYFVDKLSGDGKGENSIHESLFCTRAHIKSHYNKLVPQEKASLPSNIKRLTLATSKLTLLLEKE